MIKHLLDHGFVRFVDHMGDDTSIVRAARVSYDADWRAGEDKGSDSRLIRYLWKNRHTSPFEAVTFTFEVKAPLFVFRQWHRHRTMSYNEVSARYTELPEEFYVPELAQITHQHKDNKQMRTDEQHPQAFEIQKMMYRSNTQAYSVYKSMLAMGCPRELARSVLPCGVYSRMFCTVNLLNLLKFITLRDHEHAQYEIRVYAEAMLEMIKRYCPVTVGVFRGEV